MKMMDKLIEEFIVFLMWIIGAIPGRSGRFLRRFVYSYRLASIGPQNSIGMKVEMACPENIFMGNEIYLVDYSIIRACSDAKIVIGDRFALNGNARIIADNGGQITIGDGVMIGPNVVIRSSNHNFDRSDVPIWEQGQSGGFIHIGDDVWIASNAVIVADVTIGSHVVVAAGSVVTSDVPDFAVVGGVPAKILKMRTPDDHKPQ